MVSMGLHDGADPKQLSAVLAGRDRDFSVDVQLAVTFARASLAHDSSANELRDAVVAKWGQRGLVSLAFAITAARICAHDRDRPRRPGAKSGDGHQDERGERSRRRLVRRRDARTAHGGSARRGRSQARAARALELASRTVHDSLERQAQTARAAIVAGALRGTELIELIEAVPMVERNEWIDAVLGVAAPPADRNLPRGGVPYLPCGVDEIIAAVRDAPIRAGDVLVDLGSGLGRVAILGHLITGARAAGIEIQDHLVDAARTCSTALHLPEVSFVHADASEVELEGTVFFLYAPFNGDLLKRVLARLQATARRHPIVVCTVGMALDEAPWMSPRDTSSVALTIHDLRQ